MEPMDMGGETRPEEEAKRGEISRLLFGNSRMEITGRRRTCPVQRWMVTLEEDALAGS